MTRKKPGPRQPTLWGSHETLTAWNLINPGFDALEDTRQFELDLQASLREQTRDRPNLAEERI
jgi:hypothetical protein